VEDLFRPYPSFGFVRSFVRPSHLSFFRPVNRPSVRHMIRPSDKSLVHRTNRSSVARARRMWVSGRSVLSVCFVCLSRSWLLRLLQWITRSEVRGETSNSLSALFLSYIKRAGRRIELKARMADFITSTHRKKWILSPQDLVGFSGFYAPKVWFSLWRSLPICYILRISVKEFMLQNICDKSVIALELVLCIRFWTSFFAMRERRGREEKWGGRSTVPLFVYTHVLSGVVLGRTGWNFDLHSSFH
jgi:hypothetical protein